jgi:succinate dehydrogenase/fumarate reductase flavoprotein subunit
LRGAGEAATQSLIRGCCTCHVTCGITLTYGGLAIDEQARAQNEEGEAIAGLYAAGELVGGLYYDRYPGGAGLTSGAVFGRIAGGCAGGWAPSINSISIIRNFPFF